MIAGFGDNASMFEGLHQTRLAQHARLIPFDLPGFGAPALETETTLEALATVVADKAASSSAEIVVAHSVASIIASLAVQKPGSPLRTIFSLEGNLTPEDAYFSGTAADFNDAGSFRTAFLRRLTQMEEADPVIARYRHAVQQADPSVLWQLGCDARRFSQSRMPGEMLMAAPHVTYFYNPENCPQSSIDWLNAYPMNRVILKDASHWASVDQPALLSEKMLEALTLLSAAA